MSASEETKYVVQQILEKMLPILDEYQRRILLGSAASALGHGGTAFVRNVTGSSKDTIRSGIAESTNKSAEENSMLTHPGKIRNPGGGRKSALEKNPLLYTKIEEIINQSGDTYGDPQKPLRWTTWSLRKIANELLAFGITVSQNVVSRALDALGYSKQQNQKMYQVGEQHPDRDAQFHYINEVSTEFLSNGEPVISIHSWPRLSKRVNPTNFEIAIIGNIFKLNMFI